MGGYSYQKRDYETVSVAGSGGTSDKVTTINGSSVFEPDDITSSEQAECQIGFFGRLNYDYKGKYLLTATFREDGSSKFAKDDRWGFFPGISGGWVLTEEPWLNGIRQLNFLKLRASYGSTGNNASVGIYDAYGSYGASYMYNGNSGIKPSEMPNERLQWETSNQLDIGIEAGLFKNRIYVSADFFDKRTRNLLYEQKLPNTTGFSKFWTNLGKVRFWGYELELTTRNIVKKNFSWESKLVLSYQQNKVLKLPDNGIDKNRTAASPWATARSSAASPKANPSTASTAMSPRASSRPKNRPPTPTTTPCRACPRKAPNVSATTNGPTGTATDRSPRPTSSAWESPSRPSPAVCRTRSGSKTGPCRSIWTGPRDTRSSTNPIRATSTAPSPTTTRWPRMC